MQKKQIYVVLPNDTAEEVDIVLSNVEIGGGGELLMNGNYQGTRRFSSYFGSICPSRRELTPLTH